MNYKTILVLGAILSLAGCGNSEDPNVYQQKINQKKKMEDDLNKSLDRHVQDLQNADKTE